MASKFRCSHCDDLTSTCLQCSSCSRSFCKNCISASRQCLKCEREKEREVLASYCTVCSGNMSSPLTCLICQRSLCGECVRCIYPNRPTGVVCKMCTQPPLLPVECGRCGWRIEPGVSQYFCELCAQPICDKCVVCSFECGVLKCETCCPDPIRLLSSERGGSYESRLAVVPAANGQASPVTVSAYVAPPLPPIQSANQSPPAAAGQANRPAVSPAPMATPGPSRQDTYARPSSKYAELYDFRRLGEGGQGVVYKCRTADGEEVVSKEMLFEDVEQDNFEAQLHQAMKMQRLSHKHLIKYLHVMPSRNPLKISVIMPYYSEGDLFAFIRKQNRAIDEHRLCSLVLQIASALAYLHSLTPPLVHRDIKPENILLFRDGEQVLLMDLDLCRSVADSQHTISLRNALTRAENSPTLEYRAPELANSMGSPKSDVFSLGVVTFVLATLPDYAMLRNSKNEEVVLGSTEWTKAELERAVCLAIRNRTRDYSRRFVELILGMLSHNPALRPTAMKVAQELTDIMEERLLGKWVPMFQ